MPLKHNAILRFFEHWHILIILCKTLLVLPSHIASGAVKSRDVLVHISMQIIHPCHRTAGYLYNHPSKSSFNWNFLCERNIAETVRLR